MKKDPRIDIINLLKAVGEDPNREGLRETPSRFMVAMNEWCRGYRQNPEDVLKDFQDGAQNYDAMVFQGGIPVWSLCEHHLAPFFGVAHIGYLPNGRIVGLSKLARLVDVFARRLQVQERLTQEIANALASSRLKPSGVGVVLRCRHSCIESRGVSKAGTITYTSTLLGTFRADQMLRTEFLRFVERADDHAGQI